MLDGLTKRNFGDMLDDIIPKFRAEDLSETYKNATQTKFRFMKRLINSKTVKVRRVLTTTEHYTGPLDIKRLKLIVGTKAYTDMKQADYVPVETYNMAIGNTTNYCALLGKVLVIVPFKVPFDSLLSFSNHNDFLSLCKGRSLTSKTHIYKTIKNGKVPFRRRAFFKIHALETLAACT
jgi:hypothetical protein